MKVFGIIIEANPFHNGHKYYIDQIKTEYNPDVIIAVVSGSFSMRGEVSLLDKFTKTSILLDSGVDLVFELPFYQAVQSADYFATSSVNILNEVGITNLAFGSETIDLSLYDKVYKAYLESKLISNSSISQKKQWLNHLKLNDFSESEIDIISKPNFTLGFAYYKVIKDNNLNIDINLIKRAHNNYDDETPTSHIASATSIRNLKLENKDVSLYIPYDQNKLIDLNKANNNLLTLLKNCFLTEETQSSNYEEKEGIYNYIKKNGDFFQDLNILRDSLKNKKYTVNKINRSLLHNLLGTVSHKTNETYLRLLGTSKLGLVFINNLPKNVKTSVFSAPKSLSNKSLSPELEYELKATRLYQNITNDKDLYLNEFKLPIRKD